MSLSSSPVVGFNVLLRKLLYTFLAGPHFEKAELKGGKVLSWPTMTNLLFHSHHRGRSSWRCRLRHTDKASMAQSSLQPQFMDRHDTHPALKPRSHSAAGFKSACLQVG